MPKAPSLVTVRKTFDQRIDAALELFYSVQALAEGTWDAIQGFEALYPGQARRVVGLSFLQIVASWDEFVESVLIRYLMGARAPSGFAPTLRLGRAGSFAHAYQLITGKPQFKIGSHYTSWSSWTELVEHARLFVVGGAPFATLSPLQRDRLADATKIRNRVAHGSSKVRSEFVEVAKRHMGITSKAKLPQGFTVGQLLLNKTSKCFGSGVAKATYFEHYHRIFRHMADHICPS